MKIQHKLFLFLFGFSLILVSVLVLLMQWSIGKGMVEYVVSKEIETLKPVISQLGEQYKTQGNWEFITEQHHMFRRLISKQLSDSDFEPEKNKRILNQRRLNKSGNMPPSRRENRPPPHRKGLDNRPPLPPKNQAHYALLDASGKHIVGNYLETLEYTQTPIEVEKSIVGYFAVSKRNQLTQGYEVDFIEKQQHYLWLIGLIVMLLVGLVTFPLTRHIVEPIKQIIRGMHKLTQGDYSHSIKLNRKDELSELSRDYNELALTLAENETARKRWLANISHELRTPVAILRGELEAMIDKVRPLNLDNITSANDEVKHLQRLIDDLNLLTSADIGGMTYRKEHENIFCIMQSEAEKYRSYLADAGITLTLLFNNNVISDHHNESIELNVNTHEANIYVDKTRLFQLFENIINNCIKYSSAKNLNVLVAINHSNELIKDSVIITFEDDGIGVDDKHLPHLFEHLYRVEDSRNRKTGGSGLGLSICRHIVSGHQGSIVAKKSALGGLAVIITLPLA